MFSALFAAGRSKTPGTDRPENPPETKTEMFCRLDAPGERGYFGGNVEKCQLQTIESWRRRSLTWLARVLRSEGSARAAAPLSEARPFEPGSVQALALVGTAEADERRDPEDEDARGGRVGADALAFRV